MLSDTFSGIAPADAPMFVLMQLVGGALALGVVRLLYPTPHLVRSEDQAETTAVE